MSKLFTNMIVGLIILTSFSCKQNSTESLIDSVPSFSFRSSKCTGNVLLQRTNNDSSFTYSFTDKLMIDFSVIANCCPDSNRFIVSNTFRDDTLLIMIVDTAEYVCRCLCPYFIHAEYENLLNEHYVVRCVFKNLAAPYLNRDPLHLVNVYRTRYSHGRVIQ